MNCATHNDTAAVAFCRTCGKPLCANCTATPRSRLLRALSRSSFGGYDTGCWVRTSASCLSTSDNIACNQAFERWSESHSRRHPGWILSFRSGRGLLLSICQRSRAPAHLRIANLRIRSRWKLGRVVRDRHRVFLCLPDHRRRTHGSRSARRPARARSIRLGSSLQYGRTERGKKHSCCRHHPDWIGRAFPAAHHEHLGVRPRPFWPLILIFLGAWMFARAWGMIGSHPPGCTCASCRVRKAVGMNCTCDRCRMRKIMGPAILMTIGTLFLLQSVNIASFDRTWPAILLVIGVVKLLQSNASSPDTLARCRQRHRLSRRLQLPTAIESNAVHPRTSIFFFRGGAQCLARCLIPFRRRFRLRFRHVDDVLLPDPWC